MYDQLLLAGDFEIGKDTMPEVKFENVLDEDSGLNLLRNNRGDPQDQYAPDTTNNNDNNFTFRDRL